MRVVSARETVKAVRDLYGAPTRCLSPFPVLYRPGEHKKASPITGRVERYTVPCGYCRVCVATRKSNWTGRLIAEASTSAAVAFVTLTYKSEPESFAVAYRDIQLMLKGFRERLDRERGTKLRFFCSGERGEKNGRLHWHLLFFFDKPITMRRMKKRQIWHFWKHGWAHIQNLSSDNMLRKVRYVAKYCVKDAGKDRETFMRCSLRPGIGSEYFVRMAIDLAKAGLPANGGFKVGNVAYTRGPRKGQLQEFRLTGAMARNFLDVYETAWPMFQGAAPVPPTRFRHTFSENYVSPHAPQSTDWRTHQETIHVPARRFYRVVSGDSGYFFMHVGRDICMITLAPIGKYFQVFDPSHEEPFYIERDIREVYEIEPEDAARVNSWLRAQREQHFGEETWVEPVDASQRRNTFEEEQRERRERYREQAEKSGLRLSQEKGSTQNPEGVAPAARFNREDAIALGRAARKRFGTETHDDEFCPVSPDIAAE